MLLRYKLKYYGVQAYEQHIFFKRYFAIKNVLSSYCYEVAA